MATVRVQAEPFDTGAEIAALVGGRSDVGGIGCFIGTVRGTVRGPEGERTLESMTLEHYPAMTERALAAIAAEAETRWPLLGCTVLHRMGRLLPGEQIVLVLATSAHRQAALDATGFLIDWLKTRAPFWKSEAFVDGGASWVGHDAADEAAARRWSA